MRPNNAGVDTQKNIIFLSYDGLLEVLPAVSKLTKEQAMYYFLSGYTAKVAGTRAGELQSQSPPLVACGRGFPTSSPTAYAKLLGEKIDKHGVHVYLVNTG